MEIASQPSHREEEIRREKDHEQTGRQAQRSCHEFTSRQNDADGCAAIGKQVHDNDRIELHCQHFHSHDAEVLGLLIHLLMLVFVRLIDLERCHSLQVFQKGAAQLCILVPIFGQDFLRDLLHHHNGSRDQRDADQQNYSRAQTPRSGEHSEQRDGCKERIEELWHILAKIALQLVNSLDRLLYQFGGRHLLAVTHTQLQELFVDQVAHLALYGPGRQIAHPHSIAGREKADQDRDRDDHNRQDRVCCGHFPAVEFLRRTGDQADHDRVEEELDPLQHNVAHNELAALRAQFHESFVKHS